MRKAFVLAMTAVLVTISAAQAGNKGSKQQDCSCCKGHCTEQQCGHCCQQGHCAQGNCAKG